MRICSLVPSATEIIFALGLGGSLFGVTHECDYPTDARNKPRLTKSLLPQEGMSSSRIDEQVRLSFKEGKGIYELDIENLIRAEPDIIFTQGLCRVCAVSYSEVRREASKLLKKPEIASLDAFDLKDILKSITTVGEKCGRPKEATELVKSLRARIERVSAFVKASGSKGRRVFFAEWSDPLMSCGHWVPELIELAGGEDGFGKAGKESRRLDWEEVRKYSPEYVIVAPCGFDTDRAAFEARSLAKLPGWFELPAVKKGHVYATDGNAYFSRPGPRVVDGLEILAAILNPGLEGRIGRRLSETDYRLVRFD
jgi:iron complex transport system substrate-binding protein